jgi:hypothetical protein
VAEKSAQIVDTQKSPENLVRKEVVGELPNLNRTVVMNYLAKPTVTGYPGKLLNS